MITVHRASARYRSGSAGITTWHAFSSGAHYDPANVSFGPVLACDEHLVEPGAGFATHAHARAELLTWVLDGALRHRDDAGREHVVRPGQVQYQRAGAGIRHAEVNASEVDPLRFVQLWLASDADEPAYALAPPPARLTTGSFDVVRSTASLPAARRRYLHVASGAWTAGDHRVGAGDSLRVTDEASTVVGAGVLLVVTVEA